MLGLVLLMAAGLLVTAGQPSSECTEISRCGDMRRHLDTSTYELCKANTNKAYSYMGKCYDLGYNRLMANRDCKCRPDNLNQMYLDSAPSAAAFSILSHCLKMEDALRPGCPAALKDKCQIVLPELGGHLLWLGTCDARQRKLKEQIVECARYVQTADLSGCGSIQVLVNYAGPIVRESLPLLCSGCNVKKVVTGCVRANMGMMSPSSACGIKRVADRMMACMEAGLGGKAECKPAITLIKKAKEAVSLKYIYEACDIETRINYAQTYAGWSCQGSKNKRRTPLADRLLTKRSVGDSLSELWTALTRHLL